MIIIVGGGIVGLVLASALARENFAVTVIENKLPDLDWEKDQWDARVSAINIVSQQILMNLNIWPQLPSETVTPLCALQVWDHQGGGEIRFDSAEMGEPVLGYIVENRALIKVLWQRLAVDPHVKILSPAKPQKIMHGAAGMQLALEDQSLLTADLIIGADGGHSWVREEMGINPHEKTYQQQALIAVARTQLPHQNTGWQNFLPTGPLGVLPLSEPQTVAFVWSNDLAAALRLQDLSAADFDQALTAALINRLGFMHCLTVAKQIPLVSRHAEAYVQPKLALVGDAAHSIHPLAGQGVNLGLLDAAVLVQVLQEARKKAQDIGSLRVLQRYQRWRKGSNTLMLSVMTGFKELFGSENVWLARSRSQGFAITNQLPGLKNCFMRYAMGRQGDLPVLAQKPAFTD